MPGTARPATISWRAMSAARARNAGCRARPAAAKPAASWAPGRSKAFAPGRGPEQEPPAGLPESLRPDTIDTTLEPSFRLVGLRRWRSRGDFWRDQDA